MQRREFIATLGGAAAWPVVARAQQGGRVRRLGVLTSYDEHDPEAKSYLSGFMQGLSELGWTDGSNIRIDIRWAAGNIDRIRIFAKELVGSQPDVILSGNTPETAALQHETQSIPIVFATVSDPVGSGFVASVRQPAGSLTGFMFQEASIAGKLLQLLTEIAPGVRRAALMFNPETAPYVRSYYVPQFDAAARSLGVAPIIAPVHGDAEIQTLIVSLGREPGSGLVCAPDAFIQIRRTPIISLTARYTVPAVYGPPLIVRDGGLLSYGPDLVDQYRRAAAYVDRILRGAKPAELPVQLPVKFVMAVNTATAKALGLAVPQSILLSADEVIQ
jgi:putative tryptophan/tyrosine transport system substrate-binding protein